MTILKQLSFALTGAALITLETVSAVQAGVMGGQLFSTGGNVVVQILGGTAGYTSYLSLYSPRYQGIGNNREVGKSVNLGNFSIGQELLFGINVEGQNTFLIGPSTRNADGLAHAVVDFLSPGVAKVGFEDLWAGGDWDYDDVQFLFQGAIAAAPPRPPVILNLTSDLTVRTNTFFDFSANATDPDSGDLLTFLWDFNNDGLYSDFKGRSGQWSFSKPGDYKVGVKVVDKYGLSTNASFNVKAVPEPSSMLALLAFGTFGVASRLKRKQQQKVLNSVVKD